MRSPQQRPVEIRTLFNPVFCSVVLLRAIDAFQRIREDGIPFSLLFLILPLCMHRETRELLRDKNRSYFFKIVSENQKILVDFPTRTTNMIPFTLEGLGVAMHYGLIEVTAEGHLKTTDKLIKKTLNGTDESVEIQKVAARIGTKLGEINDKATVYFSLGIKP